MSKWLTALIVVLGVAPLVDAQAPTRNPHGAIAFTCQNCHTTTSWAPLRAKPEFDHNRETKYPLRGAHASVTCNACHVSKVFADAGTRCADCHADLHQRQFGAQCENCHTVQGWRLNNRAPQDHMNRFPLLGAHASATCDQCHKGAAVGAYVGLSTACVSCHVRDFNAATNPPHLASGFSQNCSLCHGSMTNWTSATFNHASSGFPLTGAHATIACTQCHVNNNFALASGACYPCHTADYASAANPPHAASGVPLDCAQCHSTVNWTSATFNHANTGFALTGAHVTTQCVQCHVNNNYALTSGACYPCHVSDWSGTNNPPHAPAGFPQDCSLCHSTTGWTGSSFNHASTGFALTGAHVAITCAQCHTNNNYALTSGACYPCHTADWNSATNPPHAASAFPQDCSLCHSTTNWTSATFNHTTTGFALTGAHATVACAQCHLNNNYSLTSTVCNNCHAADYNGTTNPNHASAGFPRTCETCHSTTAWTGAVFNHTYFSLTHGGANSVCATCHTNANDYSVFQCTNCHTAAATNPRHTGIRGYVYNSTNCYACHRR